MNELLIEAFRHSGWATKQLIDLCRGLSREQLTDSGTTAAREPRADRDWSRERDIIALLNHTIRADRGYVSRRDERPGWADSEEDSADLDELERRSEENFHVWERFFSEQIDPAKMLTLDDGQYEAEQSVLVVQALYHAHIHLEQISAILIGLGAELPDIQAWSYAEATGQARPRNADLEKE
jgi:uncharacterized damage-inducible protein DinB